MAEKIMTMDQQYSLDLVRSRQEFCTLEASNEQKMFQRIQIWWIGRPSSLSRSSNSTVRVIFVNKLTRNQTHMWWGSVVHQSHPVLVSNSTFAKCIETSCKNRLGECKDQLNIGRFQPKHLEKYSKMVLYDSIEIIQRPDKISGKLIYYERHIA